MENADFVLEKFINHQVIAELSYESKQIVGVLVRTADPDAIAEGNDYTIIVNGNHYYSFNANALKSLAIVAGTTEESEEDAVSHPAYYTDGKIEVIDFIEEKRLNFCRGNAVKYIVRAGKKDPAKEAEDLEKAVWYLSHEIARLKGKKER